MFDISGASRFSNERLDQVKVVHALQDACIGTDLAVYSPSGLSGGSVLGEEAEAYVIATDSGYQVEMWRHDGDDAYRVTAFTRLDDAIRCAIDAVGSAPPLLAA